jgi:hypothetical protein
MAHTPAPCEASPEQHQAAVYEPPRIEVVLTRCNSEVKYSLLVIQMRVHHVYE